MWSWFVLAALVGYGVVMWWAWALAVTAKRADRRMIEQWLEEQEQGR